MPWLGGVALPVVWEEAIGATDSHIHDEIELQEKNGLCNTTNGDSVVIVR